MPFTRAGFNPRADRLGVFAMIHREGFRNWRPSQLIRFECGDLCWYGGRGLSWGTCRDLSFRKFVNLSWNVFNPYRAWRCDVDTRAEEGEPWKTPAPPAPRKPRPRIWEQLALLDRVPQ